MSASTAPSLPYRVGQWLPSDQRVLDAWIEKRLAQATANPVPLLPIMEEFKQLIEGDAAIYMLFHQMLSEVPHTRHFRHNPAGGPQVRSYHVMLQMINTILTEAPEFNTTGLVGFPINAILDWSMDTPGGFAAFLNEKVNRQLKRVLNEWARFLGSADSRYILNDDPVKGWLGAGAMAAMPHFVEHFVCEPTAPYYGFTCWDDFFTRQFREGQRPVASPDDDKVITNACESAPYRLARGVKQIDRFWIKAQPYSLTHMLDGDSRVAQFDGGTVYQAFLDALSYHRWHSPVNGRIVKAVVVDGSYYSETPAEGEDDSGPNDSQAYITEVATRALVFIEADNPAIGLMCFMAVGMAEVSTCQITVYEGQQVRKGQQLGMFHFGGSTHCLIFRPGVELDFTLHGHTPGLNSKSLPVNSQIARVK
ncbi:phosphatidylserine decarboxylase family protein [Massilia antarctica]|uniref:Phosphatidylserine decarboxylase family protein n=1 Tax=Massilia antarctica TaxID=2765360 RepID=A0AA48WAL6_9BURK|nr:phosphatidylserine decarboxylase family protein [Massilia antarctica]QPI48983.1 phosphatidylserine decarboxylase family protein [Massilia antarctica]